MKRVIGVEGFENSGKSDILRKLARDLISRGGKVKSVYRYGRLNQACDASILDGDDDFVIVIEIDGTVIVIVSLGDYENMVKRIKDLLKQIDVDPDILIDSGFENHLKQNCHIPDDKPRLHSDSPFAWLQEVGRPDRRSKSIFGWDVAQDDKRCCRCREEVTLRD